MYFLLYEEFIGQIKIFGPDQLLKYLEWYCFDDSLDGISKYIPFYYHYELK